MSKILRCSAPGCRTLTANGLCDHCRAEQAAKESPWDKIPSEVWEAGRIKAEAMYAEMSQERAQLDARREDLAALKDGAAKMARRAERPTFSGELP